MVNINVDSSAYTFFDKTHDMFLFQNVYESTRVWNGQEPSFLVLVFSDEKNLIVDIEYQTSIGLSDHVFGQ